MIELRRGRGLDQLTRQTKFLLGHCRQMQFRGDRILIAKIAVIVQDLHVDEVFRRPNQDQMLSSPENPAADSVDMIRFHASRSTA